MNLEENFFQYFQEDEGHATFPELPVPTTSTPFDNFTLHPVEQRRETLEETTQNGFRPWKWKSPLSPIPKRKNAGDPLRNGGYKRKITKSNYHEKSSVRNQLQHILANLGPECPFFLKSMIHCNVVHGFSLTLPKQFCYLYLPFHDTSITLEDERGEEYRTIFLGDKRRLSGGWRGFCVAKKLVLGDLLVFHLVSPLKFKVYKVEPDSLTEVDAAFILLKLSLSTLFDDAEEYHPMPPPKDACQDNIQTTSLTIDAILERVDEDHSEDYSDHRFGSNLLFHPGLVTLEDV
ncbi:B3 domain-containing protein At5g42700-like isoform X1 [Rosa rugosa]|uniref:B3 domain-containing protein At5g42700-like isoform X1 n=1 Tax=Rosa rugosa TaxID=74645 RepID=UPI002B413519|nr:B3 domain-containing protein At5g42700-like isoform X1 [Rosa rugosa]